MCIKQALTSHPDFTLKNPNRLRSLVSVFSGNMSKFHAKAGAGYAFIGDICLEVDKINPQVLLHTANQYRQHHIS
jgi:aminopeptidase N